jgi:hypothetical protein
MIIYKVSFDITIADTDAPPSDWLPLVIEQVLENGESVANFTSIEELNHE